LVNTEVVRSFEYGEGSRLMLATQEAFLLDGSRLAERGVMPDVTLEPDWYWHFEREDPYIQKALELLRP
jgi:C-terminal processing protease CtpA/Prc